MARRGLCPPAPSYDLSMDYVLIRTAERRELWVTPHFYVAAVRTSKSSDFPQRAPREGLHVHSSTPGHIALHVGLLHT